MADGEVKVKKERDPIMMVCFVVFLLTSCAIVGATVYNDYIKADERSAVIGDTVTVNYTGTYYDYYGNEHSVVFDTSMWSVADDDDVLKSNDFTLRDEKNYTPLKFKVGGTDVLEGFGNAVIGHKIGEKIKAFIPAGSGYNAPDTEVEVKIDNATTIPLSQSLTLAQFKEIYGYELKGYGEIEKSAYGWPASASYNTIDNTVTVLYKPEAGETYTVVDDEFGKVTLNVSADKKSYTYDITDYIVTSTGVGGKKEIQMIMVDFGTEKFYITSVMDADNNKKIEAFTYKTVEERYNQDLYFEIELVSFE